jgi:hypothetical protein
MEAAPMEDDTAALVEAITHSSGPAEAAAAAVAAEMDDLKEDTADTLVSLQDGQRLIVASLEQIAGQVADSHEMLSALQGLITRIDEIVTALAAMEKAEPEESEEAPEVAPKRARKAPEPAPVEAAPRRGHFLHRRLFGGQA